MDKKLEVIALLAAVLLVGSNSFVLTPILSEVASGLGTSQYKVAWSISSFGAATAASALTLSGLIDSKPAGRVLGSAALLLSVALIICATSLHWLWLCIGQAVAGIAVGVLLPGSYATAVSTAKKGRESARLGLVLTGWAFSLVVAVPVSAFVAEHAGWRIVYLLLAVVSMLVAACLFISLKQVQSTGQVRVPPLQALKIPGVLLLLLIILSYMTAFYGSFAFFGAGLRNAFGLSAQGAGMFVMAYGLGFGVAGVILSFVAPNISSSYMRMVLLGIAVTYASWHFAVYATWVAFLVAVAWGMFNQLALNALMVSLNRKAADARGAAMGLSSAVTYISVFAGPFFMGPVFAKYGFVTITSISAVIVFAGAMLSKKAL